MEGVDPLHAFRVGREGGAYEVERILRVTDSSGEAILAVEDLVHEGVRDVVRHKHEFEEEHPQLKTRSRKHGSKKRVPPRSPRLMPARSTVRTRTSFSRLAKQSIFTPVLAPSSRKCKL